MSRLLSPLAHCLTTPPACSPAPIGCRNPAPSAVSPSRPTRAASPAPVPLAASGAHAGSLVAGGSGTHTIRIPPTYDPGQPSPPVLVLHGGGEDVSTTAAMTGMGAKADREGGIDAYSEAIDATWNARCCCGTAPDIAFIRALISAAQTSLSIDARRISATGRSIGAILTYQLSGALCDLLADIAPVGGTISGGASADAPPGRTACAKPPHGRAGVQWAARWSSPLRRRPDDGDRAAIHLSLGRRRQRALGTVQPMPPSTAPRGQPQRHNYQRYRQPPPGWRLCRAVYHRGWRPFLAGRATRDPCAG